MKENNLSFKKSNVEIISGNGSISNPYTLSMQ